MEIIEAWEQLEFSFHSILHVDLEAVWHSKSWRWFSVRVHGLLSTDTPLARHFIPSEEPAAPENDGASE
jgi:hypothetical protein